MQSPLFEGDPELFQNLFRKRELLRLGDESHKDIRALLLILGGGSGGGALGAGAARALHDLDLVESFDTIVGVSTGAGIAAYTLAGKEQTDIGASTYYEECVSRKFFRYWRRPWVDIDFAEMILRQGAKKLDVESVLKSRPDFYAAIYNVSQDKNMLVDAKTAKPDLISAVRAAIAAPIVYNHSVRINDMDAIDNPVNRFPIREAYELFNPTDILVIANCTATAWRRWSSTKVESVLGNLFFRQFPVRFREAFRERVKKFHHDRLFFQSLQERGVRTGVIFSPYDMALFTRDVKKIRGAYIDSWRKISEMIKLWMSDKLK